MAYVKPLYGAIGKAPSETQDDDAWLPAYIIEDECEGAYGMTRDATIVCGRVMLYDSFCGGNIEGQMYRRMILISQSTLDAEAIAAQLDDPDDCNGLAGVIYDMGAPVAECRVDYLPVGQRRIVRAIIGRAEY